MAREMLWNKSVNVKLGGTMLLLAVVAIALIVANVIIVSDLRGAATKMNLMAFNRTNLYRILFHTRELFAEGEGQQDERMEARERLTESLDLMDYQLTTLLTGDPSRGIERETDPSIVSRLAENREHWNTQLKPLVERILAASSRQSVAGPLDLLDDRIRTFTVNVEENIDELERVLEDRVDRVQLLQYVFLVFIVVALSGAFWIVLGISRRTRQLAATAEAIAAGDRNRWAPVEGSDELAMLGQSFNTMTGNLRDLVETEQAGRKRLERLLEAIGETAAGLNSAGAEILAATTQQASGAEEQAAAVSETVSTVDEITQTAEQSAERAKLVAESSERAADIGEAGRKAVDRSVESMGQVREQTESIAESILALAEQAQAIGEIIGAVNDIAEQTNLLALNAGIEASRAGEHGAGFTVVAREIKELADQAKKATAQVRRILGEIQQATNSAVMTTEEGTKSVNATIETVNEAGETIGRLAEVINDAARAASQIAASAGQQATGMAQIQQAMKDVNQATTQGLASTQQTERAAKDLNELGAKLKGLLEESEAA